LKLALHRSITFWSGILVIAFIGWAWRDSKASISALIFHHGRIANEYAGVTVTLSPWYEVNQLLPHRSATERRVSFEALPAPHVAHGTSTPADSNPLEPFDRRWEIGEWHQASFAIYGGADSWLLFIPHWLILLAIALPWTGLLLWRARRRKRVLR
jgi:hypothetical protein